MRASANEIMSGTMPTSNGPGAKSYASTSANMHVSYKVTDHDTGRVTEEWIIAFSGSKAAKFGVFTTSDKKVQKFLEDRIASQKGSGGEDESDIMLLEDFMKRVTPVKERIKSLEDQLREVTEQNRLLELAAKGTGVGQAGQFRPAGSK